MAPAEVAAYVGLAILMVGLFWYTRRRDDGDDRG